MSKMTDKDIKDGLTELAEFCRKCGNLTRENDVLNNALDLINRQQAELDDLKRDTIPKLQDSLKRANKYGLETDKENEQLKAEIERLQKENEELGKAIAGAYELNCFLEASRKCVRNEAYNEFVERFESKLNCIPQHHFTLAQVLYDLDKIKKEMVGEGNG